MAIFKIFNKRHSTSSSTSSSSSSNSSVTTITNLTYPDMFGSQKKNTTTNENNNNNNNINNHNSNTPSVFSNKLLGSSHLHRHHHHHNQLQSPPALPIDDDDTLYTTTIICHDFNVVAPTPPPRPLHSPSFSSNSSISDLDLPWNNNNNNVTTTSNYFSNITTPPLGNISSSSTSDNNYFHPSTTATNLLGNSNTYHSNLLTSQHSRTASLHSNHPIHIFENPKTKAAEITATPSTIQSDHHHHYHNLPPSTPQKQQHNNKKPSLPSSVSESRLVVSKHVPPKLPLSKLSPPRVGSPTAASFTSSSGPVSFFSKPYGLIRSWKKSKKNSLIFSSFGSSSSSSSCSSSASSTSSGSSFSNSPPIMSPISSSIPKPPLLQQQQQQQQQQQIVSINSKNLQKQKEESELKVQQETEEANKFAKRYVELLFKQEDGGDALSPEEAKEWAEMSKRELKLYEKWALDEEMQRRSDNLMEYYCKLEQERVL